jgi:3'(2'), 5'-bisphosphate nucleotidase
VPPAQAVDVSWTTLSRLVALTQRAGAAILACTRLGCERKADGSPVTNADREAESIICPDLRAWDASIPIVSEESPLAERAARAAWRRYWLVDPLDGTKEFLAGRPDVTVNIALIDENEPVVGVVAAPALGTVYVAGRHLGAWRLAGDAQPVRLHVRAPGPGAGLRIVESRSHPSEDLEAFVGRHAVMRRTQLGSSLKFCWLAEGWADCYPRFGPTMAWDVAAGDCVFRNAAPRGEQHPSPLKYDPLDFRQGPFVIGFVPEPAAVANVER